MLENDGEQSSGWGPAIGQWVESRAETVATLLVGIVAAFLGFFGVLRGDKLSSAILAVLVVFAGALLVDRERRIRESKRVDRLLSELTRTGDAVRVLASPTPYHVVANESEWDVSANGDAVARRTKRLRFSQNEVIAVTDWFRNDGDITDIKYFAGTAPTKSIHTFPSGGRSCNLVALDRVYMRDEEQDFVVIRAGERIFAKNPDRAWVAPLESTSVVRIAVRWKDRLPTEVRFLRQPAGGNAKPAKFLPTVLSDGRVEFKTEIPEPEPGERFCVEWDW